MTERQTGQNTNGETDGREQPQTNADEKLRDPGHLDFKKAREGLKKIVKENQKWLKEMANR